MRNIRAWFAAAVISLLGFSRYSLADSTVGKPPFPSLATLPGMDATGAWESFSHSFPGKSPTVVLSDGPPPRNRAAQRDIPVNFFYLYSDLNSAANHFQPIGYMGDYQDVHLNLRSVEDPADGLTCIKIDYVPPARGERGWAGIYWLDPKSNWGASPAGRNLSGMSRLTFWARGAQGGEKIAIFKVGGIQGNYPDTGTGSIGPVWLTQEWKQYVIDLRDVDLSKVSGGFAWSASASDNVGAVTFYLDEIRYER